MPLPPFAARPFASPFVAASNPHRTGRLFGFIPNYATVEAGAPKQAVLTTGGKFKLSFQVAFDPYEFVIVGAVAAVNQAQRENPWSGQGFMGYGKTYAVDFANQAIGTVMTEAVFPSLLRQDPRYFQRSRGGFLRRFAYAGSRIFVTRGDSGGRSSTTPNLPAMPPPPRYRTSMNPPPAAPWPTACAPGKL